MPTGQRFRMARPVGGNDGRQAGRQAAGRSEGKPHPLIELRVRIAAHRRDNFKLLDLKRNVRTKSLDEVLAEMNDDSEPGVDHQAGDESASTSR